MYCTACGTKNEETSKFCGSCGHSLQGPALERQAPAPAADWMQGTPPAMPAPTPSSSPTLEGTPAPLPVPGPAPVNGGSKNKAVIAVVAVIIIAAIVYYFVQNNSGSNFAYQGVKIGDSFDKVKEKLGPFEEEDSDGPFGVKSYMFEEGEVEILVQNDEVQGIMLQEEGQRLDNGIVLGRSTVKDIIKEYGEGNLRHMADEEDMIFYLSKDLVIGFEIDSYEEDIFEEDIVVEIQGVAKDTLERLSGEDFEKTLKDMPLKYKKGSSESATE